MKKRSIVLILLAGTAVIGWFCLLRFTKTPQAVEPSVISATSPAMPPPQKKAESVAGGIPLITNHRLTGTNFNARLRAIHALPNNISPSDLAALYAYLRLPTGEPGEAVLKNDLLNALRRQTNNPDLTALLVDIYQDKRQPVILRDYAIQHLVTWYPHAQEQILIRNTLWSALEETDSSIAGTALLGLHRLAARDAAIDSAKLNKATLTLAQGSTSPSSTLNVQRSMLDVQTTSNSELTRIAALRLCGERGIIEILPTAKTLALKADTLSIQTAAIATLGDMGAWQEEIVLLELIEQNNLRLRAVADNALARLRKRTTHSLTSK